MTTTTTCPSEEMVWQFAIDPESVDHRIRGHIEECPRCFARVAEERNLGGSLVSAVVEFTPDSVLAGNYRLQRFLGRGGFGEVWLAHDQKMDRPVAIKILRSDRMQEPDIARFRQEIQLLARITEDPRQSLHIVPVYTCDVDRDRLFLVMRYIEGESLGRRVRLHGPLTWQFAARYIANIAEALLPLHSRHLVHRDIKPDNLLWEARSDEAFLADFGITTHVARAAGSIGGTPGYIPPELLDGECSAASDVFALAASFYHLVTGHPPFSMRSVVESIEQARQGLPRLDAHLACVPESIEQLIRAGLDPNPRCRVSLESYHSQLRGAATQSLLAAVRPRTTQPSQLDLTLEVQAGPAPGQLTPIACQKPQLTQYRDLEVVPEEPDAVEIEEGKYIKLTFTSRSGGYLTLLNVGSSGAVQVLYPNKQSRECLIPPGGQRSITMRVRPPAGVDEAFGILTRNPNALLPQQWTEMIQQGQTEIPPARSYRDLEVIADEAGQLPGTEWTAVGVKICHR
ncbi:MAG: serine/threonine-protein kinase [Gemmataceae bacterium]